MRNKSQETDKAGFEIWNKITVEADTSTEYSYEQVRKKIRRNISHTFTKIAAIFLLLCVCAMITYHFTHYNNDVLEMEQFYASVGNINELTLSDGSKVKLNSGTTLLYPKTFSGKERTVYLNGEASFDVAHNAKMPFIVSADGAKIKVLGTVFNVKAYSDDANIVATLKSGSIEMSFGNSKQLPVILEPNQELLYNKANDLYALQTMDANLAFLWQNQHLIFRSTVMSDALKMLERRFNVKIYISTEKYDNERITALFSHDENLTETLNIFKNIIPNFKYKINENKVIIY